MFFHLLFNFNMNSFNLNITGEALSLKKKLLPGLNRIGSKSNNDIVIEHPFICP